MRRREFITLLGSIAAALPFVAHAQQQGHIRRIGVLIPFASDHSEAQTWLSAFVQGMQSHGWIDGRNLNIIYRWAGNQAEGMRIAAAEMVALRPDVILSHGVPMLAEVQRVTQTIPVVFAQVPDPVESGFVRTLAQPGGNITGFTNFEYATGGKWLELLKETAPQISRVLVMQNVENPSWQGHWEAIEAIAPAFGVELLQANARNSLEIENAITTFAQKANGGLISLPSPIASTHRGLIVSLVAHHRLPTIYPFRSFPEKGGLMSYGVVTADLYRRAASYIDRILTGAQPANLPVQRPTKFELVINLKTLKALGLGLPSSLLAQADEVIE